jgi:hypothetical protein
VKISGESYVLTNTCAFDAFVQLLCLAYCDSVAFIGGDLKPGLGDHFRRVSAEKFFHSPPILAFWGTPNVLYFCK